MGQVGGVAHRMRDGSMEVIGGFARYWHDLNMGLSHTHVKVFDIGRKHTHTWAADKTRAEKIRAGIATTVEIIRHMESHNYDRLLLHEGKGGLHTRDGADQSRFA